MLFQKRIKEPFIKNNQCGSEIYTSEGGGTDEMDKYQKQVPGPIYKCYQPFIQTVTSKEMCIELFDLRDLDGENSTHESFFRMMSMDLFFDMLFQLSQIGHKEDDLMAWLPTVIGEHTMQNPISKRLFEQALKKAQDHGDDLREYLMDVNQNKDQKFNRWIKDENDRLQLDPLCHELNFMWTHKDIWNLFKMANEMNFFSTRDVYNFLEFREKCFDLYHLLDKNFDNYLGVLTLFDDRTWVPGDLDLKFFRNLEECLQDSDPERSKQWINELMRSFENDYDQGWIDYHQFQKILWTGHLVHGLDYEKMHQNVYNQRTKGLKCIRDIRSQTFQNRFH